MDHRLHEGDRVMPSEEGEARADHRLSDANLGFLGHIPAPSPRPAATTTAATFPAIRSIRKTTSHLGLARPGRAANSISFERAPHGSRWGFLQSSTFAFGPLA